ncbi:uncharacterized protein BJ212DRAFT_1486176 [Suillus subaureus]|uniref:Uncharacterized protein n=1 Tax=Suillus subaureus TaxID=48587 RepID=A0A9P7DXK5_9AGAM|nr:uncharacterized protein BJ212DRAFT_1486176 [Suillus subaureus]KAG1805833.1 hypothetical protein BJ212DRAFT_1486176 [Suillus subaureus]
MSGWANAHGPPWSFMFTAKVDGTFIDLSIPGEFHYEPANPNDTMAEAFLTSFLQTRNSLLITIQGDSASTPFASLQPALEA